MDLTQKWISLKNGCSLDNKDSPGSRPTERPCRWRGHWPLDVLTFCRSGSLFPDFVTQPRQSILKAVEQEDSAADTDRKGHTYT